MTIRLRTTTIRALVGIITGDHHKSPYRSVRELDEFFSRFGDVPAWLSVNSSRSKHTEFVLQQLQGTDALAKMITAALHPAEFVNTIYDCDEAGRALNEHLVHDALRLVRDGRAWRLTSLSDAGVAVSAIGPSADPLTHDFIHEQIAKCARKLAEGDNDGAITNARSLIEAVLLEIEQRVSGAPTDAKGDLLKQYKAVQKLLNLQPDRDDLHDSLRQMLTGMVSIVNGIAAARNAMSDAHARPYKPAPHHARLVVNSANTLADFLLASYEVQREGGLINPGVPV